MRGRAYATLRTVPSGGARHAFETYLVVRHVEGLRPGAYHYLPMEHALEFLHPVERLEDVVSDTLCGQSWAAKASVIFYWSVVPYRAEWRYGPYAYAPLLVDAGHVGENLYLACASQGLGTCGLRAFRHELCCELFGLDGEGGVYRLCRPGWHGPPGGYRAGGGVLSVRQGREFIRQHRTIAASAFAGYFSPIHRFEKLEIHKVFLRFFKPWPDKKSLAECSR